MGTRSRENFCFVEAFEAPFTHWRVIRFKRAAHTEKYCRRIADDTAPSLVHHRHDVPLRPVPSDTTAL